MSAFRNTQLPWWLHIGVKIVLSRLPIPYSFWKKLHLFEHGDMNQPDKCLENFLKHARLAGVLNEKSRLPKLSKGSADFNVLELGPGDSLSSLLVAKALGASHTWLVDAGSFAKMDMGTYQEMMGVLREKGFNLPFEKNPETVDELIKVCDGKYLIEGNQSLAKIPSESIDFSFSQVVLSVVLKSDFNRLVAELYRIMKPNSVSHHRIDLKDFLGGGLNNLRFSEATWEGDLLSKSGFYSNRIRFREMIGIFEKAGFTCIPGPRIVRWAKLPTPREKLDPAFRDLEDEDLLVDTFDILLKKD